MSTTHKSKSVKCPFYRTDSSCKILCEGLIGNETSTHTFKTKNDKDIYINRFCCRRYKDCRHYLTLMISEYYDDSTIVDINKFHPNARR